MQHNARPSPSEPPMQYAGGTFKYLTSVLLRGKWWLAAAFALCVGLAVASLAVTEPVYQGRSTLVIDGDLRSARGDDVVRRLSADPRSNVLVEAEVLRSLDMAQRVATRLLETPVPTWPLLRDAETDSLLTEVLPVARRLTKQITVGQTRRDVNVLEVIFESTSPEEAAHVATLYAEEYERRHDEHTLLKTADMRAFLDEQLATRRTQLDEAERALSSYRSAAGAVDLDVQAKAVISQLAALESARDAAQVELAAARSLHASYAAELEAQEPGMAARLASGLDREIASLQTEIAQRDTERQSILAKNPTATDAAKVRELDTELAALRADVQRKAETYLAQLGAGGGLGVGPDLTRYLTDLRRSVIDQQGAVNELEARIVTLDGRLAQQRAAFARLPRQQTQLATLERQKQTQEKFFDYLREKWEEARLAEQSTLASVAILDRAVVPDEPVRPGRLKLLVLSLLLGFILGSVVVFGREMMDDRVRRPEDVAYLGLPQAGVLPVLHPRQGRKHLRASPMLFVLHDPLSDEATAFQRTLAHLEFSPAASSQPVWLVTAPRAGAGTSTAAANLAASLALAGRRTVLLDANFRRPSQHALWEIERTPGCVDVLEGTAALSDALTSTDVPGLYVLPAGRAIGDPSSVAFSRQFERLVQHLRQSFDRVVLDGNAVLDGGDALAQAALADRALVLFPAGETAAEDALQTRSLLLRVKRNDDLAAVLSSFHARKAYGHWQHSGYQGHYGRKQRPVVAGATPARLLSAAPTAPPTDVWEPIVPEATTGASVQSAEADHETRPTPKKGPVVRVDPDLWL